MATQPNGETISGKVLLGTGPPTREELLVYYPAKFTWEQLKCFVNSGDLGLLKRDKKLQKRYNAWAEGIKEKYGSMVNYLLNYRLRWGQPDALSLLPSALDESVPSQRTQELLDPSVSRPLPSIPPDAPLYFAADTPKEFISIIQNDWPYSAARVEQDGLWGFTGTTSLPPSPSLLPTYLPALSEWGITIDKLIRSAKGTDEEEALVKRAGSQIDAFVRQRWVEDEWETAWFVNPPRLQSVLGLAHIHVFARHR